MYPKQRGAADSEKKFQESRPGNAVSRAFSMFIGTLVEINTRNSGKCAII
jgi:hypothetical protein